MGLLLATTPTPWHVGDDAGEGWRVTGLRRHPEFLRYRLARGTERTVIEVTFRRSGERHWTAGRYRIQPAPGQAPRYALLRAMKAHLHRWDRAQLQKNPRAPPLVSRKGAGAGLPRGPPYTRVIAATIITVLLLALLGFALRRWLIRWSAGPVRWWLALSARLNPRPDAFGPLHVGERNGGAHLLALSAGLVSAGLLLILAAQPPVTPDSCIDLALARDCYGVGCHFTGNSSSFLSLKHGALWSLFLAACHGLGLGAGGIHLVVTLLHGLAIGGLVWLLLCYLRPGPALLAGALFLVYAVPMTEYPKLWNPALAPVLGALHFGALLALLRRGTLWTVLLAAASLALVVDAHMVHFLLAPVLALALGLRARRPLWSAAAAVVVFAAVLWIPSRGSLAANLWILGRSWLFLAAVLGPAVAFGAGLLVRQHLGKPPVASLGPHFLLGALVLLVLLLAVGQLVRSASGRHLMTYYLLPVVPFAAVYLARLLGNLTVHRWGRLAVLAVAWVVVLQLGTHELRRVSEWRSYWRLHDTERVAQRLYGQRYRYETLARSLRGPQHNHLLMCLASLEPPPGKHRRQLAPHQVVYAYRLDDAPPVRVDYPGLRLFGLGQGRFAALLTLSTWLQPEPAKRSAGSDPAPSVPGSLHRRTRQRMFQKARARRIFRITPRGADRARRIALVDPDSPWIIQGVTGVSFQGQLPGRRVVILNNGHRGTIVFKAVSRARAVDWPPDFLETPCGPDLAACQK